LENIVKVTAERVPESKVLLRIEIPPEQVEKAIEKTYRDLSRRVKIPGFRPGKAPRALVERYVGGAESVRREGVDRVIDDAYREALKETGTRPIGEPDVAERPEFHPGEPLVVEATVPVAPSVTLGDYASLRMEPVAVEATPQMVNEFVDELRESRAEWTSVERGIQAGDHAVIDVRGVAGTVPTLFGPSGETLLQTEGGKEVYNVKAHEHEVNPEGPIEFAPGFDEELIGLIKGGEKRFGLTLPADFQDASLANQSIVFHVTVHDVKEKHLPEVDDAFAQAVGGGETLEALRKTARERLQARLEREARVIYENALIEAVLARSAVEVPEVMIERQIDAQIEDLKSDLTSQQLTWADYLLQTKRSEEQVREDLRESAVRTLRSYLVLREVARREGVEVRPEEITAEIEAIAAPFGRARNVIRERLSTREQRERIESQIFYRKAVGRLAEIAQLPTTPEETEPAETEAETPTGEAPSAETPAEPAPVAESTPEAGAEGAATEVTPAAEAAEVPTGAAGTHEETSTHV
jgi:trigger factor